MWFQTVLSAVVLLSLLTFIILFGGLPVFQGTFIHKARKLLLLLPNRINEGSISNPVIRGVVTLVKEYGLWAIPCIYLSVVAFCLKLFNIHCLPKLETQWGKDILIPFVSILPFISTLLTIFTDPGVITKQNYRSALQLYDYDNIIFFEGNECSTCHIPKPARSKHCREKNVCIAVFDHYCIWVNSAVGHYNYKWFYLFVYSNCQMLIYGFYLTNKLIRQQVAFLKSKIPIEKWGFLSHKIWVEAILTDDDYRSIGALMIICFLLGLISTAFLLEHTKYFYLGVTTNETMKWSDLNTAIYNEDLFIYTESDPLLREKNVNNFKSIVIEKVIDNNNSNNTTWNRDLSQEEKKEIEERHLIFQKVESTNILNNIYDKGFIQNVYEKFFPKTF